MIGFNVWFTKSTDHGATWSPPVKTYGNVSWNDKPILAVSNDGKDVYASFNGPTGGDPWVASSHDAGATWSQVKLLDSGPLRLHLRRGRRRRRERLLRQSSLLYSSAGKHSALVGADRGAHLHLAGQGRHVGRRHRRPRRSRASPAPPSAARPTSTRGTRSSSADANGALVYLYDGATTAGGKQYDLCVALDRSWSALDDARGHLGGRRGIDRCR